MSPLSIEVVRGDALDPESWDAFVQASPQGSVFALHAFARTVAPGWQAAIVSSQGKWQAVMPFFPRKKYGLPVWSQPPFAQTWGPMYPQVPGEPAAAAIRRQKDGLDLFLPLLRGPFKCTLHLAPEADYLLPLVWGGFRLTPRFTYRLDLRTSPEDIKQGYAESLRRQLKKATQSGAGLEPAPPEVLMELHREVRKGGRPLLGGLSSQDGLWDQLIAATVQAGVARVLGVRAHTGGWLAAGLFGRCGSKTWYLGGAVQPGNSFASPALLAGAIGRAQAEGSLVFDFEGSMIPGIERFFRQFGGVPVPYWQAVRRRF